MESLQGRYQIKRKLGSGGMATVWLAFDPILERQVAIKMINEQFREQKDFLERFRREAAIAANLDHPAIAKVYEQGNHEGLPFIVMEYIQGPTLREEIPNLNVQESKRLAEQILRALDYAHSHGVLHRDIKSGNIILSASGPKLIDFGVAQIASAPQITIPGQIIGTAEYMAPEVAEGGEASVLSDLYSFAVLFYEMLTDQLPYPGKTAIEVLHRQAVSDPLPPSKINSGVSPYLDRVIFTGLQKNPNKRYQDAEEFRLAIAAKEKEAFSASPILPAAIAAVMALAAFFFIEGQNTKMSSFQGLDKREAQILSEKLNIEPVFLLRSGPGDIGKIFWQSKKPGESVDPGDRVVFLIKISDKKPQKLMPDLVGKSLNEGKALLRELALDWQISFIAGDPGIILKTMPTADAPIGKTTIQLQVGRTPLPDLLGESVEAALIKLSDLGISYKIEYSESTEAADRVLSQEPAGGTFASEVTLIVSRPSSFRQVPDLLGLSEREALLAISSAGFSAITLYQESPTPGLVEKQTPKAGSSKYLGQVIRIWIGREEENEDL